MNLKFKINSWLKAPFDKETQNKVKSLLSDPITLQDSFYKNLEFGTGGMRGIMGVGTNRVNKYTLGLNTQGLSNYLNAKHKGKEIKAVVAYDSRNNSKSLARIVANIFTANKIKCFLFSELRPTPELSFAVRYLKAHCGIVLTASHNPPEYNGYKVYNSDGGQITPPEDSLITGEINKVDFTDILFNPIENLLHIIDSDLDQEYFKTVISLSKFNYFNKSNYNIVFTSLHGTAIKAIPQVLNLAGYNKVTIIKEQAVPDGNFPTVKSPNPEEKEALFIALQKAKKIDADIVIGTDPDCDRLGIAVKTTENSRELLNGNQTMLIMTDYLLRNWEEKKMIQGKEFIATTIVSSPIIKKIANHYGVKYFETLTGFKWIAKLIKDNPTLKFIGGGEESFGFLVGDRVRDKDAVSASLLACEIGSDAKSKNKTIFDFLIACYKNYGFYLEDLVSITKEGEIGAKSIFDLLKNLRETLPKTIAGIKVKSVDDYLVKKTTNLETGEITKIILPKSDVLIFKLIDSSIISIRPSGTEPKIKFYFSVNSEFKEGIPFTTQKELLQKKIELFKKAIMKI